MKTLQKAVVIVIDNPLRDLSGAILIACDLSKLGIKVYLVEMYNQIFDITFLRPQLVLLNFVRNSNLNYIKYYNSLGIQVAVLDTEGAWSEDLDKFSNDVMENLKFINISQYFLWGNEQLKSILKNQTDKKNIFSVTGNPRYDFCFDPLKKTLEPKNKYGSYFLINTRFPRSNPEYTDGFNQEIQGMLAAGYSERQATKYLSKDKIAQRKMLVTISKLAKKYPNINFIVRPHPFESCRVYEQSLSEKNIHIIKEGSSMAWIKSAEMLIHLNCTTAIESFFLNVPSVNLKWLSHPILDAPIAEEASNFNASSFDDLLGYIEKFFASKHVLKKIKKSKVTEFYSNTGISSKIIAKKIAQGLKSNISKEVKLYSYMDLKIFLRVLFGFYLFNYITKLFKSAIYKKREGKQINLLFVNDLLNRISRKNFKFRGVHYPTTPSFSFLYKWVASNRIIEIKKIS